MELSITSCYEPYAIEDNSFLLQAEQALAFSESQTAISSGKEYVLKRGDSYIHRNENSSFALCDDIDEATRFKYNAAQNILNNQICQDVRHLYSVVRVDEDCGEIPATEKTDTDLAFDRLRKSANTLLKHRLYELGSKLSTYDKIILDIRHFAREESTRLNACQAAKVFYKLQQVERDRVKAKEEITRIGDFLRAFEKAAQKAEEFAYPDYKPRCIENMYEYIGI